MSQCVAVCCSVLQCVAVCCSVLQCVAMYCSVLQSVAECRIVLQCVAVCLKSSVDQAFFSLPQVRQMCLIEMSSKFLFFYLHVVFNISLEGPFPCIEVFFDMPFEGVFSIYLSLFWYVFWRSLFHVLKSLLIRLWYVFFSMGALSLLLTSLSKVSCHTLKCWHFVRKFVFMH